MEKNLKNAMIAISLVGFVISLYLTAYHYAGIPLICQNSGIINCANVLNSQYAYILGIPVALLGLAFFIVEIALVMHWKERGMMLLWNMLGLGFVIYFLYAEYSIGNICEYCTIVHLAVISLLLLSAYDFAKS